MRVSIGDATLFVETVGEPEHGPMVIGLHGGPGLDGSKLRYQLEPLADVARIVVPDQRGHGRSDHAGPETWNLATWADDLKRLADALTIAHPVVLGVSFGGFVAQRYAAAHPDHPAGLILVSTSPRFPRREEAAERLRRLGGEPAVDVFERAWDSPSEETAREWRRVVGPLMSRCTDPDPALERVRAGRIETMDVNVHFFPEGRAMDLRDSLGAIRCPTLVVVGEHDPLIPVHLAREIVDAVPDGLARLELIEDASHDVFADNPADSYRIVREFLREPGTVRA